MTNAIARFEQKFAARVKSRHAFAFWKGRVAMYAILKAMGIGEGDEVILPGYTCVMDVNPVKYLGARPVYVDIEPATYNMDVSLLSEKITGRTKVIIAQHTYGYPCEMDAIMEIATHHGIPVVEDCCLALGSTYKAKLCGTFGAAAYWSFQWNKPFTTGIGGMASTSGDGLAEQIRRICNEQCSPPPTKASLMLSLQRFGYVLFVYPRTTAVITSFFRWLTAKGLVIGSSSAAEFKPEMPDGFLKLMGPGQARAGLRQLKELDRNIAHRQRLGAIYTDLLRERGWELPRVPEHFDPVLVRYPVRVADKKKAVTEAPDSLVELGTWFECPLHPQETPMALYDYQEGMCPQAEKASREVVNLPTHPRAGRSTARRSVLFMERIGPAPNG